MKKLIFMVAVMLLAATLLTACGDNTTPPVDGTTTAANVGVDTPAETTTEAPVTEDPNEPIVIFDGQTCDYVIFRSEYCGDLVKDASVSLRNALCDNISDTATKLVSLKTDFDKEAGRDGIIENDDKEILIGKTNRKESQDVHATLSENEYVIKWVGNKLVIIGYDDYVTSQAVALFIEQNLSTKQDAWVVAKDINMTGTATIQKIALEEGAEMRIMTFNIAGDSKEYAGRKDKIVQVILDYLPDVVGFQEAKAINHKDILRGEELSEYYETNKKTHDPNSPVNYTPILYLKSKYNQLEGGVEWNNSRYTGTNTKSLSWTVLERISDGKRFMVINIHGSLWSTDYKLPEGETHDTMNAKAAVEWKEDNMRQMLAKIDEMRAKYGDIAVLTTGDYNYNNTHSAYQIMKSSGLGSAQEYAVNGATTSHGSYHNTVGEMPAEGGLSIDHIFYTPEHVTVLKHVIGYREIDVQASDHCPVYVDVKLN